MPTRRVSTRYGELWSIQETSYWFSDVIHARWSQLKKMLLAIPMWLLEDYGHYMTLKAAGCRFATKLQERDWRKLKWDWAKIRWQWQQIAYNKVGKSIIIINHISKMKKEYLMTMTMRMKMAMTMMVPMTMMSPNVHQNDPVGCCPDFVICLPNAFIFHRYTRLVTE